MCVVLRFQKEDVTVRLTAGSSSHLCRCLYFYLCSFTFSVVFTLGEPIENLLALVFDQLGNFAASLWPQGTIPF
jgi:hypothetical protein